MQLYIWIYTGKYNADVKSNMRSNGGILRRNRISNKENYP